MADAKLLAARDLHTTRPKVLATLLDCSVDTRDGDASFESRLAALKEAMVTRPDRRTLVLCSSPSTVDRIVTALGETPSKNSVVRALHPEVAASERAATIAEFSADGEDASPTARASAAMVTPTPSISCIAIRLNWCWRFSRPVADASGIYCEDEPLGPDRIE